MFKGTGVALITPFDKYNKVDYKAMKKLVDFQLNNGTDFLLVLGTTSEAATLTEKEKEKVVNTILEANNKKLPILLGMGANNTSEIVNKIDKYDFDGIDGILSVCPYYNKPNQMGLYKHFEAIASSTNLPVILYNVPGRTSSNLNAKTTLKLAENHSNIIAIKEASANFEQIMDIIKNKPPNFNVLSGDDLLTLPLISIGLEGVISVIANAKPKEMSDMVNLALSKDFKNAKKIHYKIYEMCKLIFEEGNPAGIKGFLKILNICEKNVRLPLVEASDELMKIMKQESYKFD